LAKTVQICLTVSQNFYAETILRTLGREMKGKGTRENGLAVVREYLKELGITEFQQLDGSGLTPENKLSPRDMVKLFRSMHQHKEAKVFYDALAVNGGKTGTLRKRMKEFPGQVHAKTGHINSVATLSGYVESERGDTYIFSILINGGDSGKADRLQDRICELLHRN
jgi:D-alanyl-D-alanine carboxypeptidase/D-alanyl-D-alanine-endopeptidase (penicillin-binding protein 4)